MDTAEVRRSGIGPICSAATEETLLAESATRTGHSEGSAARWAADLTANAERDSDLADLRGQGRLRGVLSL